MFTGASDLQLILIYIHELLGLSFTLISVSRHYLMVLLKVVKINQVSPTPSFTSMHTHSLSLSLSLSLPSSPLPLLNNYLHPIPSLSLSHMHTQKHTTFLAGQCHVGS